MADIPAHLSELAAAVEPGDLLTDPASIEHYRRDFAKDPAVGMPCAVLRARSVEQVVAAMRWATATRTPVVPRGAGSGLSGGSSAVDGALTLSLDRMTKVEIDVETRTARVEPGALNIDVKRAARVHGLWYPPDPSSYEICSIGGNLATNAGGLCCVKYGVTTLLDAPALAVSVSVPLSTTVIAPATGTESFQVHDVRFDGRWDDGDTTVITSVTTEVTSLCPCSKAISDYGAHNQRSRVTLSVTGHGDTPYPFGVQQAVRLLERCASAPVVPLVKRPDERVLTMQAYDHPVFVEDIAREVSHVCRERGLRHSVRVRNLESIHSHDAVAYVAG